MRNRRCGQNAMAEIKDQRSAGERRQHVIDFAVERRAAGEQRQRIDIALHRGTRLQHIAGDGAGKRPVDPDGN